MKIALTLTAVTAATKVMREKQRNTIFIHSTFPNGTYLNNGTTEVFTTADKIIIRPYQG